jgi:hypothetical protein
MMVLPWDEDASSQIDRLGESLRPVAKRIIVVVDDREATNIDAIAVLVAPIESLPWSRGSKLSKFIVKDEPDTRR